MTKSIYLLILLLGIIMMTIGYMKKKIILINKNNKVKCQILPKSLYEQQFNDQQLNSLDIFKGEENDNFIIRDLKDLEPTNCILDYNISNFISNDKK